jgi:MerR family transcriptional regulator, light-induced transcriptional regulator
MTKLDLDVLQEELVPIREISRMTGINTVTLRAWERRYGLLVPQRTSKGHRLYSYADIDRVKEIQLWLGRGLAISKVKALLADQQEGVVFPHIDSHWLELAKQIQQETSRFRRNALERLIEETFSLYPAEMIADNLILPLLLAMQGDEPGRPAQQAFFSEVLSGYIYAAQSRQRHVAQGTQILVATLALNESIVLPQLFNLSLLVNQFQSEFIGRLAWRELLICVEALSAKIVVINGYETLNPTELQLHLNGWREKFCLPIVLMGNLARVFSSLNTASSSGIYCCDSHQQALSTINQLLKG